MFKKKLSKKQLEMEIFAIVSDAARETGKAFLDGQNVARGAKALREATEKIMKLTNND